MTGASDPDRRVRRLGPVVLVACMAAYAGLVTPLAGRLGVAPAEAIAQIHAPLQVITRVDLSTSPAVTSYADGRRLRGDSSQGQLPGDSGLRWVFSESSPRLSVQAGGRRFPVLVDAYSTCHLAYAALGVAELSAAHVWGPRAFVAALGVIAILAVYQIARILYSSRTALVAAGLSATSLPLSMAFAGARYDLAMALLGMVVAPAAWMQAARSRRYRWALVAGCGAGAAMSSHPAAVVSLGALFAAAIATGTALGMGWKKLAVAAAIALVWLGPMGIGLVAGPRDHAAATLGPDASGLDSLLERTAAGNLGGVTGAALFGMALAFLVLSVLRADSVPRRGRIETTMLVAAGMVVAIAAILPKPVRDGILVCAFPLLIVPMAAALQAGAQAIERSARARLPAMMNKAPSWACIACVAMVPIFGQVAEQWRLRIQLREDPVPRLDRAVQDELANFLVRNQIRGPMTTVPYMVGTLELLSRGKLQPLHGFALLEAVRTGDRTPQDLRRALRRLLEIGSRSPRFIVLPRASGADRPWADEVRAAFVAQAAVEPGGWDRVAAFGNASGEPLLEVYRIEARPEGTEVTDPPLPDDSSPGSVALSGQHERPASPETLAALGGLAPGDAVGKFAIESISEPFRGAILIRVHKAEQRAAFELRLHAEGIVPIASAGEIAIYYRRPERGVSTDDLAAAARALATRLESSRAASSPPVGLQAPASRGISL